MEHKNNDVIYDVKLIKIIRSKLCSKVIGDKLNYKNVKNYGYISHNNVLKLLIRTRYSIVSSENIFSFFTIDAINNKKDLVDEKIFNEIKHYKKNFIKFDFNYNNLKKLNIKMSVILGLNFSRDTATYLIKYGKLEFAIEEERITLNKTYIRFPIL